MTELASRSRGKRPRIVPPGRSSQKRQSSTTRIGPSISQSQATDAEEDIYRDPESDSESEDIRMSLDQNGRYVLPSSKPKMEEEEASGHSSDRGHNRSTRFTEAAQSDTDDSADLYGRGDLTKGSLRRIQRSVPSSQSDGRQTADLRPTRSSQFTSSQSEPSVSTAGSKRSASNEQELPSSSIPDDHDLRPIRKKKRPAKTFSAKISTTPTRPNPPFRMPFKRESKPKLTFQNHSIGVGRKDPTVPKLKEYQVSPEKFKTTSRFIAPSDFPIKKPSIQKSENTGFQDFSIDDIQPSKDFSRARNSNKYRPASAQRDSPLFNSDSGLSDLERLSSKPNSRPLQKTAQNPRKPPSEHVRNETETPDSLKKFKTYDIDMLEDLEGNTIKVLQKKGLKLGGSDSECDLVHSDHSLDNEECNFMSDNEPSKVRCPLCDEEVDPELLEKHSNGSRMNIRRQEYFCRLHKRASAEVDARKRGYPTVDWGETEKRLKKHKGHVADVLNGQRSSHFASQLAEKVAAGRNRTLMKTDDSLVPGYYGPRGLRVMTDFVLSAFARALRNRAVEDRLVSARGHISYVHAVLVPELAVRLIMEDMDVTEKRARDVMRESIDVGELLQEDMGDVVMYDEDCDEVTNEQQYANIYEDDDDDNDDHDSDG